VTEFGVSALLEVSVPDSELRQARAAIEDELGDIQVGVDPPSRRSLSGGPSGASERLSRENAMSRQLDTERNDVLHDIHDELETIGASGGGGGGGGGGLLGLAGRGATAVAGSSTLAAGGSVAGFMGASVMGLDWLDKNTDLIKNGRQTRQKRRESGVRSVMGPGSDAALSTAATAPQATEAVPRRNPLEGWSWPKPPSELTGFNWPKVPSELSGFSWPKVPGELSGFSWPEPPGWVDRLFGTGKKNKQQSQFEMATSQAREEGAISGSFASEMNRENRAKQKRSQPQFNFDVSTEVVLGNLERELDRQKENIQKEVKDWLTSEMKR